LNWQSTKLTGKPIGVVEQTPL